MAKQTSVALLLFPHSTPVRLLNSNDAYVFFSVFLVLRSINVNECCLSIAVLHFKFNGIMYTYTFSFQQTFRYLNDV